MSDEPIPSVAEALTEIRRLRARIAELEGAPEHSLPDAASIKMFATAVAAMRAGTLEQPTPFERLSETQLAELDRVLATTKEGRHRLQAANAMVHGTLEQPTPDEPATYTHNVPPSAPPHDE